MSDLAGGGDGVGPREQGDPRALGGGQEPPFVYVDVSDMYMSTRAGRIVVDMAGPLANLVTAALATAVAMVVVGLKTLWLFPLAFAMLVPEQKA